MDLITVTREEGLRFSIRIRDHLMTTDMSVKDGGKDGGPAPVEIMGASMGACLATLVQAYCDTRGYTDGDVAVSLTIEMVDNPNRVGGCRELSTLISVSNPQTCTVSCGSVCRRR